MIDYMNYHLYSTVIWVFQHHVVVLTQYRWRYVCQPRITTPPANLKFISFVYCIYEEKFV